MADLSVVLPCYNEAGNIAKILERYRPLAQRVALELILVDNGSTDATAETIDRELLNPLNAFARTVKVDQNIGYGHGIQTGLARASAQTVAFSHADLQCPPEHLLVAFDIYKQQRPAGELLVKGRRRGPRARLDRMVTWFYNRLSGIVLGLRAEPVETPGSSRVVDVNAQPKLFDRSLVPELAEAAKDFTYDLFVLEFCRRRAWRIVEFDAAYEPRQWGKSKLAANPWVRLKTSLNAFQKILELKRA
jgi:glycosyltransferase involved in cell wall biosynthesis